MCTDNYLRFSWLHHQYVKYNEQDYFGDSMSIFSCVIHGIRVNPKHTTNNEKN